jgi:transcriptional regulator with XRE-family HTH domain
MLDFCHYMKESISMRQSLTERVVLAIRVEMVREGLTTTDLAERIGEQYLWLHRRLKGTTPFLLEDLQRIAEALRVPMSRLVGEDVAA